MASTKGVNTKYDDRMLKSLKMGITNKIQSIQRDIEIYEKESGNKFPIEIKKRDNYDYVNPDHYKQDDGKQTWERMVDKYGLEKTAIFCELNAFKYEDRMGKKPNEDVDREKSKIDWYLNKAKELWDKLKEEGKKRGFFN